MLELYTETLSNWQKERAANRNRTNKSESNQTYSREIMEDALNLCFKRTKSITLKQFVSALEFLEQF